MLLVFPDSADYEVHILGGAKSALKILGQQPNNWYVIQFGEMYPKDFLSNLDVFVFYPHPNCIEAFSRVVLEAMAVGVPVILPYRYQKIFHEAAIYAEPTEVKLEIDHLMKDDDYYESQVETASRYLKSKYGYNQHAARLKRYFSISAKLRITYSSIYQMLVKFLKIYLN
jgi:glycosyltransferase involved in cell wall biosynthesis